jgi:hypothetical protein
VSRLRSSAAASRLRSREQRAIERPGDAEVDELGDWPSLGLGHQHVRGLEVAVQHRLLMRVLHAVADGGEQLEPRPNAEAVVMTAGGNMSSAA